MRNRKNSLIIFTLLLIVTMIFFLGNSVLDQMDAGMKKSYVENYTGHLVIKGSSGESFSLFGANKPAVGEFFPIPLLENAEGIEERLGSVEGIESTIKQVSGLSALDVSGRRYTTVLFGVDLEEYGNFFPGLEIVKGALPGRGRRGALLTEAIVQRIGRETGKTPEIGDPLLFTTAGATGFKIREIPLAGIYTYQSGKPALDDLVIADVGTVRALNSIVQGSSGTNGEEIPALPSIDDLFGGDGTGIDDLFGGDSGEVIDPDDLFSSSGDLIAGDPVSDSGGWDFLLIKLADGYSLSQVRRSIETALDEAALAGEVMDWREAAGMEALMIRFVQILYNIGFLLIVAAGIIAIVNILLISLFEREGEIGTLRAIGATKSYVRRLILLENLILAFTAGTGAVVSGIAISTFINSREIAIGNSVLRTLMGGDVLSLAIRPGIAFVSVAASIVIALLSLLYPLNIALKIKPATAMAGR